MITPNNLTLNHLPIRVFLFIAYLILRSDPKLHPSRPMIKNGDTETFNISPAKIQNKLCKLAVDAYTVIKIEERTSSGDYFRFYAITGDTFTKLQQQQASTSFNKLQYENEIASITCQPGWVGFVKIQIIARNCGLATVLTELCMIDKEIPQITDKNKAFSKMYEENRGNDEIRATEGHLRTFCMNLVGLEMEAQPYTGAYAYFSAAIRLKYHFMAVQPFSKSLDKCEPRFKYYQVERARNYYDEKSGRIEDGKGDTKGSGYQARWYFCKYSRTSF